MRDGLVFYFNSMLAPHKLEQGNTWFQEEARAERQANLVRIMYMLIWLASTIPGLLLPAPSGSFANISVGVIWLIAAIGYQVYLGKAPYRSHLKYVSTTFDVLMTGLNLYLYHFDMGYSTSLKAPPFMNFMMVLMLASLRFNKRLPFYGTLIAIGTYVGLFAYLVATQNVQFGTPLELFTTEKINLVYQIYRLAYLATAGALIIILVSNVHRLVGLRVAEIEKVFAEKAQRQRTQDILERYFTPEIADYLLDFPQDLGGRLQPVTVMITDLRGFTALSENLGPVASIKLLNKMFARLTKIVFKFGGMIDKFTGDGMLLVFGAPDAKDDDSLRAVQAALEMQQAVTEMGQQFELELNLGIGIHSGDVIFGNIGSPQRMELTVIGDTVNTASRIEVLNKKYKTNIILTEPVYKKIAEDFATKFLAEAQLRGKTVPLMLYSLGS
jgi:class 3 adenylate cyclase